VSVETRLADLKKFYETKTVLAQSGHLDHALMQHMNRLAAGYGYLLALVENHREALTQLAKSNGREGTWACRDIAKRALAFDPEADDE
jgi:hypothetical protein